MFLGSRKGTYETQSPKQLFIFTGVFYQFLALQKPDLHCAQSQPASKSKVYGLLFTFKWENSSNQIHKGFHAVKQSVISVLMLQFLTAALRA